MLEIAQHVLFGLRKMGILGCMNDTKSTIQGTPADDSGELDSIQTYVSDMLALERHIAAPLQRQLEIDETQNYARAISLTGRLKNLTDAHVQALDARLESLGGHPSNPVKSAWSGLLGAGAAAVGSVRKTKVSKNLRDDYTALSLAAVSYSMLNATALGLGDSETAALAQRGLTDYAGLIMEIGRSIPEVVLQELADDGRQVDVSVAGKAEEIVERSWRSQSGNQPAVN
jgi:ferritin-like metal-binding protein YciE